MPPKNKIIFLYLIASISGISLSLSLKVSLLAWIALVPYLYLLNKLKSISKWHVILSGLIFNISGYFFIFKGILYGYSLLYLILLILYVALFWCLFFLIFHFISKKKIPLFFKVFIPSAFYVIFEHLKTLYPSFPESIAVTQSYNPFILPVASFIGFLGITFLLIYSNIILTEIFTNIIMKKRKNLVKIIIFIVFPLLLIIFFNLMSTNQESSSNALNVSVLQGNVPIAMYRGKSDNDEKIQKLYFDMLKDVPKDTNLIVFPEESFRGIDRDDADVIKKLKTISSEKNVDILLSIETFLRNVDHTFNSMIFIANRGEIYQKYHKINLLPVAEGGYTKGSKKQKILKTKKLKIAPHLCFESLYPSLTTEAIKKGANLIVITANDVGFGNSALPEFHMRYSILRAVENNRYTIHASQGGPSSIIHPTGKIIKLANQNRKTILYAKVNLNSLDKTFYTQNKHLFPLFLVLLLFISISIYLYQIKNK